MSAIYIARHDSGETAPRRRPAYKGKRRRPTRAGRYVAPAALVSIWAAGMTAGVATVIGAGQ